MATKEKQLQHANNFVKFAKAFDASDDFCDMEIFPAVVWICQHPTNTFKITFEIQTLECLLA